MPGALLDTNALYWLVSGERQLSDDALIAIALAQQDGLLFVSPITAWEMALAVQKTNNAPNIGSMSARKWFVEAVRSVEGSLIPIGQKVSSLAAEIPTETGHKDPGDCFIVASAKHRKVPVLTRDLKILKMADDGYVEAIKC